MNAQSVAAFMVLILVGAYVAAELYVRTARAHDTGRARQIRRRAATPWYEIINQDEPFDLWLMSYPSSSGPCR